MKKEIKKFRRKVGTWNYESREKVISKAKGTSETGEEKMENLGQV